MLVMMGGRERTESEYKELLAAADFQLARIAPSDLGFSVIEGVPLER